MAGDWDCGSEDPASGKNRHKQLMAVFSPFFTNFVNDSSVPFLLAPLKFKLALKQACRKSVRGALASMAGLWGGRQTSWWSLLALRWGLWVSGCS